MNIKPQDATAKKWAARASAAQGDYTTGVQQTTKSWAANTAASAQNWATGVQQAVADKRFENGVTAAGDGAWKNGSINKGGTRYSQGVQGAQSKFQSGFAKFAQALSSATLPPRFPKGDPGNSARVQFVNTLLRNVKLNKAS